MAGRFAIERLQTNPTIEVKVLMEQLADPLFRIAAGCILLADLCGRNADPVTIAREVAPFER